MFATLTDELLDLTATEWGVGAAGFAQVDDPGGCCGSGCCSVVLCCFLCQLCW